MKGVEGGVMGLNFKVVESPSSEVVREKKRERNLFWT